LHKQYGKVEIISCNNSQYHSDSAIFWISLQVNSKDGIYFAKPDEKLGIPKKQKERF